MAQAAISRRPIYKVAGDATLLLLFGTIAIALETLGSGVAYHMRDPIAARFFVGVRAAAPELMVVYPALLAAFFAWSLFVVIRELPRLLVERNPYLDAGRSVAATFAPLTVAALCFGAQTSFAGYLRFLHCRRRLARNLA